jgi:hypothetical protein
VQFEARERDKFRAIPADRFVEQTTYYRGVREYMNFIPNTEHGSPQRQSFNLLVPLSLSFDQQEAPPLGSIQNRG